MDIDLDAMPEGATARLRHRRASTASAASSFSSAAATASSSSSHPQRPAAPTSPGGASTSTTDPDTCRICRGEGTPEEPLFFPCKCSGSIKYVHQDCLMEWLSHSQKKHCELCKTSFRFTKLYAPSMPQKLPLLVVVRHLARYLLRNLLAWLRVALVASVWLGWLPYLTRWEWSFFFWISEEGLIVSPDEPLFGNSASTTTTATAAAASALRNASVAILQNASALLGNTSVSSAAAASAATVCPSSPLFASAATTAAPPAETSIFPLSLSPAALFNFFLDLIGAGDFSSAATANTNRTLQLTNAASAATPNMAAAAVGTYRPTLLSEVGFLRNLTRYSSINWAIIYALEGQIITILVIVGCVLVILVRDYVVQQQPELNMRAAFAAAAAGEEAGGVDGAIVPDMDDNRQPEDVPMVNEQGIPEWEIDSAGSEPPDAPDLRHDLDSDPESEGIPTTVNRIILPPEMAARGDNLAAAAAAMEAATTTVEVPAETTPRAAIIRDYPAEGERPAPLVLGTANIVEGATVQEYLRVYREAGGDPDEMLKIARAEHLEDRLEYWLRLTQHVADKKRLGQDFEDGRPGEDGQDGQDAGEGAASGTQAGQTDAAWSAAWPWGDEANAESSAEGSHHSRKGKEREDADQEEARRAEVAARRDRLARAQMAELAEVAIRVEERARLDAGGLRPRANTDGPQVPSGINPLAYNTWSFPELPPRSEAAGPAEATNTAANTTDHANRSDDEWEDESDGEQPAHASRTASSERVEVEQVEVREPAVPTAAIVPAAAAAVPAAAAPAAPARPRGNWLQQAADFMWRDLENIDPMELLPVGPDAAFEIDDRPFDAPDPAVIMGAFEQVDPDDIDELDDDGAGGLGGGAVGAGMDAEAMEDAEDLEGLMEILGMRGPVAALFQNAIFCAFLVTVTLMVGVIVPYNAGRLTVWLVANPMRPVMLLFGLARLLQDAAAVVLGGLGFAVFYTLHVAVSAWTWLVGGRPAPLASTLFAAWNMSASAALRIANSVVLEPPLFFSAGEMRNFSAISHEALETLKGQTAAAFTAFGHGLLFMVGAGGGPEGYAATLSALATTAKEWTVLMGDVLKAAPGVLVRPDLWVITLPEAGGWSANGSGMTANGNPAFWDTGDRCLATLIGYSALCLLAGLYLYRETPLSSSATGQAWEASFMDGLNQASGVFKVTLIIGIEMLVFPLYCGLLLDAALLPLFEDATLASRLTFSAQYPLTSIFVHWFVGTGYMFHFALFVSMCRKIMRRGVLYFIRDPDDPEFHPVRDVLERNVTTQLRKILFSAFVYGALVVVCLGGVVWGLALAWPGVLPVHYSSNEPVLEFPIDLMFYNFLMPLAIHFFRPSDGLHAMYTWWFRKSARILRLTWFLFGERRLDEEGDLYLPEYYYDMLHPCPQPTWWRSLLVEYDERRNTVVPRTWASTFTLADPGTTTTTTPSSSTAAAAAAAAAPPRPRSEIPDKEMRELGRRKQRLVESNELVPTGRFVRAPASDQVKIPKGRSVFLEVTEKNLRIDVSNKAAVAAVPPADVYSTAHYRFVYLPPHFRVRVLLFIVFIWLFAAVTGVAFTIVPLLFGRRVFQHLLPAHVRTNDIYAFSIGMYVLGSTGYGLWHARPLVVTGWATIKRTLATVTAAAAARAVGTSAWRVARVVYAYAFLLGVFPLLATALVELYVLVPLHTYMGNEESVESTPAHTVRLVQSWTLGLLYLKVGARAVTGWHDGTRPAAAVRAVLRHGQLDPDVRLLTRAFVVPGLVLGGTAVAVPPVLASWAVAHFAVTDAYTVTLMYRLAYPALALAAMAAWTLWGMAEVLGSWRGRIRDEAYLIGERLHNFGVSAGSQGRRARRGGRAGVR